MCCVEGQAGGAVASMCVCSLLGDLEGCRQAAWLHQTTHGSSRSAEAAHRHKQLHMQVQGSAGYLQAVGELSPDARQPAVPGTAHGAMPLLLLLLLLWLFRLLLLLLLHGGGMPGALRRRHICGLPDDEAPLHHSHELHILCRPSRGRPAGDKQSEQ